MKKLIICAAVATATIGFSSFSTHSSVHGDQDQTFYESYFGSDTTPKKDTHKRKPKRDTPAAPIQLLP